LFISFATPLNERLVEETKPPGEIARRRRYFRQDSWKKLAPALHSAENHAAIGLKSKSSNVFFLSPLAPTSPRVHGAMNANEEIEHDDAVLASRPKRAWSLCIRDRARFGEIRGGLVPAMSHARDLAS